MPTKANYLYDDEDVLNAPSKYVGLANSSVQIQDQRRQANINTLNEHSKGFENLVASTIPKEKGGF